MDDRIVNRLASEIKFQLQFYCMMVSCGRDEEANKALQKAFDKVDLLEIQTKEIVNV
jgi:hypothetical protein